MRNQRKKKVAGLDEAGRGPLAGPVISAATVAETKKLRPLFKKVKDSKKLAPLKRKDIYRIVIRHPSIEWGIGRVSEKIIDKINILEATKLSMGRAIKNLEKKIKKGEKINSLVIDGNFKIDFPLPQKSVIKADEKIFTCKISSIIAKVYRDSIMVKYHQQYPQYGFDRHKGYPTKHHKRMLKKYGPCRIHRKSFRPVFEI